MHAKLLTVALVAAPMLWASGADAGVLQINLLGSSTGSATFSQAAGDAITYTTSGFSGPATFNGLLDQGTYTLGAVTFTTNTLSGTNFPIPVGTTESFTYTTAGGTNGDNGGPAVDDVLQGTVTWDVLKDSTLNPSLGTTSSTGLNLTITSVSGDSAFTSFFSGPLAHIDLTFTSLSNGQTLDSLALNGGTPETASISSGEVTPAPPIGHGLPVVLAVGGLLFGAKLFERSKKQRSHTPAGAAA